MPMYDFKCHACGHEEESIEKSGTTRIPCSNCNEQSERFFKGAPTTLTTIIPSYPGCKKHKAGYVHSHADKPATRVTGKGFSPSD
jgi:putative FmdB family regulatory protein